MRGRRRLDGVQLVTWLESSAVLRALLFALFFAVLAYLAARGVRLLVGGALRRDRKGLIDRTAARFFVQFSRAAVYVVALTAYFHVIPELRALGTFLLAGVSVASVVFGLAASTTLSNLIAGVSLLLYFHRVGDTVRLQIAGTTETAAIESINLGYTRLRSQADESLIVPNSSMIGTAVVLLDGADSAARLSGPEEQR